MERVQWGQPIGKHEAVAQKIARMASNTFAMEAIALLSAALYEQGGYDIRLEAAIAKMWNTEAAWRGVDDALQIRGGRGYETADSLRSRGEKAIPVERMMRDSRINLIFEGSSEIMRLFIAREAVDAHFSLAFPIVAPESSFATRVTAAVKAAPFYLTWYPARWIPSFKSFARVRKACGAHAVCGSHHAQAGPLAVPRDGALGAKLERRQMVLFRAVDIGAELFAMAAACARAQMLATKLGQPEAIQLADAFCVEARARIEQQFRALFGPNDERLYTLAMSVLKGEHGWLEQGIVDEAYYHDAAVAPGAKTEDGRPKTEDRKLVPI